VGMRVRVRVGVRVRMRVGVLLLVHRGLGRAAQRVCEGARARDGEACSHERANEAPSADTSSYITFNKLFVGHIPFQS
jgi:hypothetical protein